MTKVSIISAICKILSDDVTIKAIVKDRVWPVVLEQGQKPPFIVVETISGSNFDSDMGKSDLSAPVIGVSIWSRIEDEQTALRDAVDAILFDEIQTTVENIKIECGFYQTETDQYFEPLDLKGKRIDYEIHYRDTLFYA